LSQAHILWFTGLSGSGKSTIASQLAASLELRGHKVLVLDGDVVRATLHQALSFTPEDIWENNLRIAALCEEQSGAYDYILVPVISPFAACRQSVREMLGDHYGEIFVDTALEECIRRDVKGLYKKALSGLIDHFIGISANTPYERPHSPEVTIHTATEDVNTAVRKILSFCEKRRKGRL
jgi:adenylyl-sulfate kinase